MGTELGARGVSLRGAAWSADAIDHDPDVIAAVHRDYAAAGATVHTANTFRTKRRSVGHDWDRLARAAVCIARDSVPAAHRIAGSIAPLEDCYRPDLSPGSSSLAAHRELAEVLVDAGCDLLLCETHCHVDEAVAAVTASVSFGIETWAALTAGPQGNLMSPVEMGEAAKRVVQAGANAILVNCTAASLTLPYVQALAHAGLGVALGAYANAGSVDEPIGWQSRSESSGRSYARLASSWVSAGATLVGGCCGTGPTHIKALAALLEVDSAPGIQTGEDTV